ncbi:MAG TPA: preprotein translocase subunit SecG [Candidatus Binatia bacterium]|nr:preprotein translocase subunit SecG [Candidatus Binatia bacterium]
MSPLLHYIVPVVHILSCFFLIVVVLLQTGKGADMGAVFGGGSQTLFGSGGAGNFLTRLTTATAIIFMLTSLVLTYGQTPSSRSRLLQRLPPPSSEPAVPEAPPPPGAPAADANAPVEAPLAAAPETGGQTETATPPAAQTPPAGGEAPAAKTDQAPAPAGGGKKKK